MNLKAVISEVDNAILNAFPFAPNKAFGLAEFYYDGDKRYPGIVQANGEVKNCFLEDQYQVSWYHRSESSRLVVIENNFGDKLDKVQETIPVQLIIYANRAQTKQSSQTIKDIFVSKIPSVLSKLVCESIDIFDCTFELTETEMNSTLVFREECSIPDVRVGLNHGLLAVRYEIKQTFRRSCTVICEC
jgi:hypothetical protein